MASTHGNLVLPPSRPVAEGGTEDHRSRRAIAPPIASRLSESAFASGPPKVSSPRCSPDAYEYGDHGRPGREVLVDILSCGAPDDDVLLGPDDLAGLRIGADVSFGGVPLVDPVW